MNFRKIYLPAILFLILISRYLFPQSQEINFTTLTTDDGLSQNQILCVFEDSQGLLWIATQDGLNLYDGYKFRVFRHEPGNENSLLDYAVNTICETDTGIFWIGTREGMSRFNLQTGEYKHFIHNADSSNSLVDNYVWKIFEDSEENLWIATRNGLSYFNVQLKSFTNYKIDASNKNSISHNFIMSIVEDENKNIWIGGRGGLDRYNLEERKFSNYKLVPENPDKISLNGIMDLFIKGNLLWIGSYSGLYSVNLKDVSNENIFIQKHFLDQADKKSEKSKSESHTQHSVRTIFVGNDNTVWAGTYGSGLIRYDQQNGSIKFYTSTNGIGNIREDYLISIIEDRNRVLWIGTSASGLNKFNLSSESFRTLRFPEIVGNEKSSISAILEDRSRNLWVGTLSGNIIRVTKQFSENPIIKYFNADKYLSRYFKPIEIRAFYEDKNDNMWVGSFGQGIYLIDSKNNSVKRIIHDENNPNSIANDFIHCFYESSDGTLWIGTGAGGLNKFNSEDNSFLIYAHSKENNKSISSNEVTSICEDKNGYIWAGTSVGGLNKLSRNTGEFEHFTHDVANKESISANKIICLFVDHKSNLWIGTFGGGLNKYNPENNSFKYFSTENGLSSNIIKFITEDSNGNLWITTDKGLCVFNVESNIFKNYDMNDGLQANEFIHGSGYLSKINGNIYIGGMKGLNVFNPADLNTHSKFSNIVFTDFRIFNKSILPGGGSPLKKDILFTDEVTLSHDENFFSFEFASLDYNNPEKNQYAYKMEGFNNDWINSGNQRIATFTNLDPGEYTFRVKASNSNGVWNEKSALIKVVILPPWWQTWWAYFIYAFAIISILLFVHQFEMKRVKLRNDLQSKNIEAKKLLEVDKLKSRFFANISHEFRTPLTLVLGLTEKLLKKSSNVEDKNDFGVIRKNANMLLQLINQLLELSRLEAGNVNVQVSKLDINKFIKRVLSSFTSLAEHRNIDFIFNREPVAQQNKQKEAFLYIDPEKFETIIYNLVSNAFKFSPEGSIIEIEVTPHLHYVDIRFTNTGVGIPEDKLPHIFNRFYQVDETSSKGYEGTGIGLALVKELVELHDGEIKVVSIEGKETTFEIRIPIGRAHYKPEQVIETTSETNDITINEIDVSSFTEEIVSSPEKEKPPTTDVQAKIILVVEDNFDLRNYISEQLKEQYTVFEAEDGLKGLEISEKIIPDLIISDIMMPKMDGYEMCKKLKKDFKTSHIPIIMLTAKAAKDAKLEGLEAGADDYLIKPFDANELLVRVRNLIKIREQMREKFRIEMILKPREVIVPSSEKTFVEKIVDIVEKNINNEKFGVDELSSELGLSRSQLHRKLKAITDQSTTEFIRNYRLKRAADLIKQDAGNMAEIAYQVGFSSQAYFTKSFTELFGCSPGEYKKQS